MKQNTIALKTYLDKAHSVYHAVALLKEQLEGRKDV